MKRLIFSLLIFCGVQMLYAQIPVTDVTLNTQQTINQIMNNATWGQQLTQMIQQGKVALTTLKYVQEVSSAVRDVSYAKELIERQVYIIGLCENTLKQDGISANTMKRLSSNISSFLSANNSLNSLISSTMTSKFKMNDSERLKAMMGLKEEQQQIINSLGQVNMIISTSQTTKSIIEHKLFK